MLARSGTRRSPVHREPVGRSIAPVPSALRYRHENADRYADLRMPPSDRCTDFDADCWDVRCKLSCWMYDPAKGICPFLTGEVK